MDILDDVRDLATEEHAVSDETLDVARHALLMEIDAATVESEPQTPRRSWFPRAALAGGAAAVVLAAGVVLWPSSSSSAAAEVLNAAADKAISHSDPVLSPGQYLKITEHYDQMHLWDADAPLTGGSDAVDRFNMTELAEAEAGLLVRKTRVYYVPADRSDDWIVDDSAPLEIVNTFGTHIDEATSDWSHVPQPPSASGVKRMPGGKVDAGSDTFLLDSYRPYYEEMPTEPKELLEWYRGHSGSGLSDDSSVVATIAGTVNANLMPADVRAASLRALALVPEIAVSKTDGSLTTLDYTFQYPDDQPSLFGTSHTTSIDVNTDTGRIVGITESYGSENRASAFPDNVPWARTGTTFDVVDSAP